MMPTSIAHVAIASSFLAGLTRSVDSAPAPPQDSGGHISGIEELPGLSHESSCIDLENYQTANHVSLESEFWDATDATKMLQDWCHSDDLGCHNNFASAFAAPWGLGQSFSCRLTTSCPRPDCKSLQDPGASGSASAYEVLVSLSNLNQYLFNLKSALTVGQNRWTGLQVAIEQDFWPHKTNYGLQDFLTIIKTIVGMVSAYGSDSDKSANQAFAGLIDIISRHLAESDQTLADLGKLESAADAWYKSVMDNFDAWNDNLMTTSIHEDLTVGELLVVGHWLDYRNFPILNTDNTKPRVTTTELNDFMYHMMMAAAVNWAWKAQGAYIVRKPMSQEDFDSRDWVHDEPHKLYYNGMGYFLGRVYVDDDGIGGVPVGAAVPGTDTFAGHFDGTFDIHGAIMSSADGFDQGGYDSDFNSKFDGIMDGTDTEDYFTNGPRTGGAFNIPLCEGPPDMSLDDFEARVKTGGQFIYGTSLSALCLCLDGFADKNGSPFTDHFDKEVIDKIDGNCNPEGVLVPAPARKG